MKQSELDLIREYFRNSEGPVHWTDNGMSSSCPFTNGWIDVYVPGLCEELGFNWLVTISSDIEDEIVTEPGSDLAMTWSSGEKTGPPDSTVVRHGGWTADFEFGKQSEHQPFGDWEMYPEKSRTVNDDGGLEVEANVYSIPEVNQILAEWAEKIGAGQVEFDLADMRTPMTEDLYRLDVKDGTTVPFEELFI